MSLGGIAIAIGATVDAEIVVVEQLTRSSSSGTPPAARRLPHVVGEAARRYGGPIFFSLLMIAVSFLPIFALEARQDACSSRWPTPRPSHARRGPALDHVRPGAAAALLTADRSLPPHLAGRLANAVLIGKIHAEERHPISRVPDQALRPVSARWRCARARRWSSAALALVALERCRSTAARLRVHAAARRGDAPVHADHVSGHLDRGGPAAAPDPGSDAQAAFPRSTASSARSVAPRRRRNPRH